MNGPSRPGPFFIWKSDLILWRTGTIGASPSGKAADFGSAIRRFESYRPSHCPVSRDPGRLSQDIMDRPIPAPPFGRCRACLETSVHYVLNSHTAGGTLSCVVVRLRCPIGPSADASHAFG